MQKKKILYISYDSIKDPISGSQVLPFLNLISNKYKITLITYEKNNRYHLLKKNKFLKTINWKPIQFSNNYTMISVANNIIKGFFICFYLNFKYKFSIIHSRGYIPGILASYLKYFFEIKHIFDMRGFWTNEKIDRLGYKNDSFYIKTLKYFEKIILYRADFIVCLTNESINILLKKYNFLNRKNFKAIPTCVDTNVFKPQTRAIKKNFSLCHLGSPFNAYDIDKVIKILSYFLKINNDIKIKILTKEFHDKILNIIKKYKIPKKNYIIKYVERKNLNFEINNTDACIFFAKNNYSIKASFPTKIAEFLACGKPIICNNFNKDVSNLIYKQNIGIIDELDIDNYSVLFNKIKKLLNNKSLSLRCRDSAVKYLSLKKGIISYKAIYNKII